MRNCTAHEYYLSFRFLFFFKSVLFYFYFFLEGEAKGVEAMHLFNVNTGGGRDAV